MTTDASDSFLNHFEIEDPYALPARGRISAPPTVPTGDDTQIRDSASISNRNSPHMQDTGELGATTRDRSDLTSTNLTANTYGIQDFGSRTSQTLPMPRDIPVVTSSANSILHKQVSWLSTGQDFPQIETLMDWQTVNFFLSLYIKHQHHLMPLVHKPTFAQDVLARRDRQDEVFRALILSLGTLADFLVTEALCLISGLLSVKSGLCHLPVTKSRDEWGIYSSRTREVRDDES